MIEFDITQYDYFLVIDLEATCSDQEQIARDQMEIIEIGAVILDFQTLELIDEFNKFVKPVRNPILTPFCIELTSITQKEVDDALMFPEVIKSFNRWLSQYPKFIFCSWGDYDKYQFQRDCQYHGVPYSMGDVHVNVKKYFSKNQSLKKRYGMVRALALANIELTGRHHRGIDDARNTAKLMPYVLGRKLIQSKINQ